MEGWKTNVRDVDNHWSQLEHQWVKAQKQESNKRLEPATRSQPAKWK